MSTTLRNSKLIENCTPSISYDNQVIAASQAFDYQMYEIIDVTGDVVFVPSIMGLTDSNLVDILAWQFHVDFYDSTRDLEFRKNLVQQSIVWHMTKGTVQLVQDVLDTYWPGGASVVEWFDYYDPLPPPYDPTSEPPPPYIPPAGPSWHDRYRFRIYINEHIIDPPTEVQVLALINNYKPISRWCEGIFDARISDGKIGWCGMVLRFISYESEAPNYP